MEIDVSKCVSLANSVITVNHHTKPRCERYDLAYSVHKLRTRHRCAFSMGVSVMKKARFEDGDVLDVLYDAENKCGVITRAAGSRGWTLRVDKQGYLYARICFPFRDTMPTAERKTPVPCHVNHIGIVFSLAGIPEKSSYCLPEEETEEGGVTG